MNINVKHKATAIQLVILLPLLTSVPSQAAIVLPKESKIVVFSAKTGLDLYSGATTLTALELKDLLHLVGFEGKSLKIAWAIVMRESRGHPLSHNNNTSTGDNSYGIFQINMNGSLGADRREKFGIASNAELLDPVVNAKAAFYMTARGTNFGSWGLGPDAYDGTPEESAVTK